MWEVDKEIENKYLSACKLFVENEVYFQSFKKNKDFNPILEHLSFSEAQYYLNSIDSNIKNNEELIKKFKENDLYGDSDIQVFDYFGVISPSTIRYIKCVSDLGKFFKDKKFKKIVEIGGGYGGLAKTINCAYDYDTYILSDQTEVNMLSKKYLSLFPELDGKISHQDSKKLENVYDVDLLISNYAVSELSFDEQEEYYNKIIKNAKYIYITYNTNHYEKFLSLISNDFTYDTSIESFNNKIIWGVNKNAVNE